MEISSNYIVVEKVEEPKVDGFQSVEIQDSFVYKGMVNRIPSTPVHVGNRQLVIGDIVLFAKYSPDTFEIENYKYVKVSDLLAIF